MVFGAAWGVEGERGALEANLEKDFGFGDEVADGCRLVYVCQVCRCYITKYSSLLFRTGLFFLCFWDEAESLC